MGKAKQLLLLEGRFNFHNDKFAKRKVKSNKKKKQKQFKNRENIYNDLYFWAREVRLMYNYSCAYCGSHRLSTHHIFYKSKFPGLKYNLNNGIALCLKCHLEVHKLNDIVNN